MPGSSLLVGIGGPEQGFFSKGGGAQLQADGQPVGGKSAGYGDGWQGG